MEEQLQRERAWAKQKEKWDLERAKDEAERQQLLNNMRDLEVQSVHEFMHPKRNPLAYSCPQYLFLHIFESIKLLPTRGLILPDSLVRSLTIATI